MLSKFFVGYDFNCCYPHFEFASGHIHKLECAPMPNVMVTLPNIGGALCSTPQQVTCSTFQTCILNSH